MDILNLRIERNRRYTVERANVVAIILYSTCISYFADFHVRFLNVIYMRGSDDDFAMRVVQSNKKFCFAFVQSMHVAYVAHSNVSILKINIGYIELFTDEPVRALSHLIGVQTVRPLALQFTVKSSTMSTPQRLQKI